MLKNFLLNKNLSLNSIKVYLYWTEVFIKKYSKNFKISDVLDFKNYCLLNYSTSTQRTIFVSINYLLEFKKINNKLLLPKQNFVFKKLILDEDQFHQIVQNLICESHFVSIRNKELLKVLWNTGLRISELINLKWIDVSQTYIKITSKNNKTRFIPYKHDLFEVLKKIKLENSKFVFTTSSNQKMSYKLAWKIFKDINIKNFSPHSLRHSFATRLIKRGISLTHVSNLLGHSNLDTTAIYLHFQLEDVISELNKKDWN